MILQLHPATSPLLSPLFFPPQAGVRKRGEHSNWSREREGKRGREGEKEADKDLEKYGSLFAKFTKERRI